VVLIEEPEDSRVTIKITFNITNRQEDRKTGTRVQHRLTLDNDRQRLNQTEGTKYTDESNITRWKTGVTDETGR